MAGVVAFAIWWSFFPSAERAIKKRIDKLASLVSADVSGSNIKRVANATRIADLFASDVVIRADAFSNQSEVVSGRDSIQQALLAARGAIQQVEVKFYNLAIEVDPVTKTNASVALTALVRLNNQNDPFVGDVKLLMRKEGRAWLITSAERVGKAQ